jgi:hypothetical protein
VCSPGLGRALGEVGGTLERMTEGAGFGVGELSKLNRHTWHGAGGICVVALSSFLRCGRRDLWCIISRLLAFFVHSGILLD